MRSRPSGLVFLAVAGAACWLGCGSTPRDQNFGIDASGYEPPIFEAGPETSDADDAADTTDSTGGTSGTGGASDTGGTSGTGGSAGAGGNAGMGGASGAAGTSVDGASDAISDAGAVG